MANVYPGGSGASSATLPAHAPEGYNPDAKEIPTVYQIDWIEAVKAGTTATLLFSAFYAPLYFMYREDSINIPRLIGSFVFADPLLAVLSGFVVHLGIGTSIGVAYAVLLWIFRLQGNGGKGMVFGFLIFQVMFAFLLPWAPGWSARFGLPHAQLQNADVMLNQTGHGNVGWEAPALVLLAHLMFGLLLGAIYRHKVRSLDHSIRLEYSGG